MSLVCLSAAGMSSAGELKVVSRPEMLPVLTALGFAIEAETGSSLVITTRLGDNFARSAVEPFDVILADEATVEILKRSGKVTADGLSCIAYTGLALVAAADASPSEISSAYDVRQVLRQARSIAVERTGEIGAQFMEVLAELDVADDVAPKLIDSGDRSPIRLVAAGEADLGVVLHSEMRASRGVQALGALPAELQRFTAFYAGIGSDTAVPERAEQLIGLLSSFEGIKALHASGLDAAVSE